MHADGSEVERLTTDAAYDDQAAFSPDGGQIAFVSTRAAGFANLWVLDLAPRKARALTTGRGGDFRPAWSPDGHLDAQKPTRTSPGLRQLDFEDRVANFNYACHDQSIASAELNLPAGRIGFAPAGFRGGRRSSPGSLLGRTIDV
jgi:hypothetical protein